MRADKERAEILQHAAEWLETQGDDDALTGDLTPGDAVAPVLRAMDTATAWGELGLVDADRSIAFVGLLRQVLDAVSGAKLLEGDFLSCAEAVIAAVSVLYPADTVGIDTVDGPDPLGLANLSEPMVLLSALSGGGGGGMFPIDLIAELIGLLEEWREAQGALPATLTPFFARLVRAILGLERGFSAQAMLRLELALKQLIRAAGRHGISVGRLMQRLSGSWASSARIAGAGTGGAATGGGGSAVGLALLWFLAILVTLVVSVAVTHWALGRAIPGQKGKTYRQYYDDLFFRKLSSGLITCGDLQAEIARRRVIFERFWAQYQRAPQPKTPHPILLAEGNAVKTLIVTYLSRCGRSPGASVTPYLRLHKDISEKLASLP